MLKEKIMTLERFADGISSLPKDEFRVTVFKGWGEEFKKVDRDKVPRFDALRFIKKAVRKIAKSNIEDNSKVGAYHKGWVFKKIYLHIKDIVKGKGRGGDLLFEFG